MSNPLHFLNKLKVFFILLCLTQVSTSFALEFNSLSPFGEPSYLGLTLGVSSIDIGGNQFSVLGQDITVDLDDSSTLASLFLVIPMNRTTGFELSIAQIGNYAFTGILSGNKNVGTVEGEQTYQGLGLNAYYQKSFEHFATRVHFGVVQTRIVTEGYLDIIGKANQSINHSENSTNAYLSLETNKTVFKDWTLGPALSFLKSSDPIQIFSLKLSKELKN